ncbi:hypothetical protein FHS29_005277, partial [Saccharothrix tamanrassetensis]|nr:hypothetical protein [Saccharothrix tamanrassetensis]
MRAVPVGDGFDDHDERDTTVFLTAGGRRSGTGDVTRKWPGRGTRPVARAAGGAARGGGARGGAARGKAARGGSARG